MFMRSHGFVCVSEEWCEDCLEVASLFDYDLVLHYLMLTDMDGF
jgi:DNA-binding response OmpR family regulator